ncbi:MAG TPA: nucleotidyltransferase family protein [Lacipirellulaceae bacterium]|jgi:CTP:molybdopterin cytidylyltransferase MocA
MADVKRIGVLLAAGRSTRMGRPKQLLPWPPNSPDAKPLVAAAFDAIACVCDEMVVVVGHEADVVIAALGEREFGVVAVDSGAEMIVSVKAGLAVARGIDPTADVLLHPADHPEVRRETLDLLIQIASAHARRAVMPTFSGTGGHPVLIAARLAVDIVSYEGPGGLRQLWIDHADQCVRQEIDDSGVVFDLDTPNDYQGRTIEYGH